MSHDSSRTIFKIGVWSISLELDGTYTLGDNLFGKVTYRLEERNKRAIIYWSQKVSRNPRNPKSGWVIGKFGTNRNGKKWYHPKFYASRYFDLLKPKYKLLFTEIILWKHFTLDSRIKLFVLETICVWPMWSG